MKNKIFLTNDPIANAGRVTSPVQPEQSEFSLHELKVGHKPVFAPASNKQSEYLELLTGFKTLLAPASQSSNDLEVYLENLIIPLAENFAYYLNLAFAAITEVKLNNNNLYRLVATNQAEKQAIYQTLAPLLSKDELLQLLKK